VEAGLGAFLLDAPAAEQGRGHAVERRCLVQPDEGVGVQPVPTDTVPSVDHDDLDVRVVDQGVRERHPRGSCADDDVVGLQDRSHGLMLGPRYAPVNVGREVGPGVAPSSATAQPRHAQQLLSLVCAWWPH
jgi:hypothetical protein